MLSDRSQKLFDLELTNTVSLLGLMSIGDDE